MRRSSRRSGVGALLPRTFKPGKHQGSPVVIRVIEHPATGKCLLLAGPTLPEFEGAPGSAGPTEIAAVRCLTVDAAGRVGMGGGNRLGLAERATAGQWRFHPSPAARPGRPAPAAGENDRVQVTHASGPGASAPAPGSCAASAPNLPPSAFPARCPNNVFK